MMTRTGAVRGVSWWWTRRIGAGNFYLRSSNSWGIEEFKLVNTVAEALDAVEECPFDLIITDHRQPHHQRLLESARLRHPATRFIVMLQQRTQAQQFFYWSRWTSSTNPCAWMKSCARFATPCARNNCTRRKKNSGG